MLILKGGVKMDSTFKDRIYVLLDEAREESISALLEKSIQYKKFVEEEHQAHQKFEKLKLSKKERKVISDVLDCQSATDSEYSLLSYIAGIVDCLKFQEYIRELKTVQKDMP